MNINRIIKQCFCLAIILVMVLSLGACTGNSEVEATRPIEGMEVKDQLPPNSSDVQSRGLQGQLTPHMQGSEGQHGQGSQRLPHMQNGEGLQGQLPPHLQGSVNQQSQLPPHMNGGENQQGQMPNQGLMQEHGSGQAITISLEDANDIEASMVGNVDTSILVGTYPIVDTGLTASYSNSGPISKPSIGNNYYGQDANYSTNTFSYTDNGDGTVTDNVTGLMWQQDPGDKMNWEEAVSMVEDFELAGYTDWRLPTIKELYSLIDFSGVTESKPYIDTDYFVFNYGDVTGERAIDSQYATTTIYDSTTMGGNTTVFGVNFADGRIKGYPTSKEFYVMLVRGDSTYGHNNFIDNGDGTITDLATGLMWMTYDSGDLLEDGEMDWDDALEWAENLDYAGYDDWKLPDAKELQSLVDYTRSPDTTNSAAIDPKFSVTTIEAMDGSIDYPYYWSSTTHLDGRELGSNAVYVAFGEALGEMNGVVQDVHGAGAQRSDPKTGNEEDYPISYGPQGDIRTVLNYVRLVRVIN